MPWWLQGLLWVLPGWLQAPLRSLVDGIKGVWSWFDELARRYIPGWRRIAGAGQWLAGGLWELARETTGTLRWLALSAIPEARDWAIHRAITWASQRLTELRTWAVGRLDSLRRWATDRLRSLITTLDSLRKWASERIADLKKRVDTLITRVFSTWATPGRLATWLVGAMWGALWRYGWSNVDRFALFFWRRRQALLLFGAREIERILAKLL